MKKILVRVAVVVVAALVAAVIVLTLHLDKVVRHAVVTAGPQITKVDVQLDSVSLSLLGGSGSLEGFALGNPEGYNSPSAIQFDRASLALSPRSLLADKVVIHHVRLENPTITFEGGLRGNNLNDLVKGMQTERADGSSAPADEAGTRKLQVDEFTLKGGQLKVIIRELGGEPRTLTMPDIQLTNLGTGPEGITSSELTRLVLDGVTRAALRIVAESGGDLGKIGDSALRELNKTLGGDAEKTARGILDLLKKKE